MKIEFNKFNELEGIELYEILKLRSEVFVVEQECCYNDVDGLDIEAIHMRIISDGTLVAYLRIIPIHPNYNALSLGRVITSMEHRQEGLGKVLLKNAVEYIVTELKEDVITISAQFRLVKFYSEFGFKEQGEIYLEDGIDHIKMIFTKQK